MTIASAITAAQGRVADAYTAISTKGGTLPATQNLANMPTAINSIPTGGTIDSLTITPTTSQQTITASGGTDGYSPITVNAVTSSIDANITAGNIKNGVSILGVTGTYTGGSNIIPAYQISSGALTPVTNTYALTGSEFSGVSSISDYALAYKFYNYTGISGSVDLSDLVTVDDHGMYYAFYWSGITGSVDLSKLTTVGSYGLSRAFYNTNISGSVDLSKLTTLNGTNYHLAYAFAYTNITSVDLSGLTEVKAYSLTNAFLNTLITNIDVSNITTAASGNAFNGALSYTPITVVRFTKLSNIDAASVFANCFAGCKYLTDIYFNALTTSSFGTRVSQFNNMFNSGGSGTASISGNVNVHFPSNLSSTIAGLTGYPNFGATAGRVTLLFDLPATN